MYKQKDCSYSGEEGGGFSKYMIQERATYSEVRVIIIIDIRSLSIQ